jgi:hypothetical protein
LPKKAALRSQFCCQFDRAICHIPTRIGRYNGAQPPTDCCGWMVEHGNTCCNQGHHSYLGPLQPRTRGACSLSHREGRHHHTNQNTEVCALTRRTECAMGDAVFLQGQRGVNSTSSDACAQRMERRPRQGRPAPLVISQLKILATQPCAGHRAPMPIICAQAVHIEHLVVFSELQAPDPGRKEIVPPPKIAKSALVVRSELTTCSSLRTFVLVVRVNYLQFAANYLQFV